MIKSNYFVIVVVIVIVTLLIVGNLVIPVQANSESILTPTPTGTPFADPNNQSETISTEQQEELKSVIQAYFEIRYQALSASQPNLFQLNGFDDQVSDGFDAKAFLDAELGKLEVEIKYAKLNQLSYVNYKYFLDFREFTFNAHTQTAIVLVVEGNEVIYEISAINDPENPTISQMTGLKHTIILRQEQGAWKVASDEYNDLLWRVLRETGRSAEELLNSIKALPVLTAQNGGIQTETTSLLPDDTSSHAYDRAGAVSYALAHAADGTYNPDYPTYDGHGGDCTNFVSQALYEGGNISMYIPDPLPPPSPNGQSGWYALNDLQRATDWNDVGGFYDFVINYGFPTEGPEGSEIATISGLMLGDVIQYEVDGDVKYPFYIPRINRKDQAF